MLFTFPCNHNNLEYHIDLLPDEIYSGEESLPEEKENEVYQYRQFMIAKRYSDYWFASFLRFMHAKVNVAFVFICAFPTHCVYLNP